MQLDYIDVLTAVSTLTCNQVVVSSPYGLIKEVIAAFYNQFALNGIEGSMLARGTALKNDIVAIAREGVVMSVIFEDLRVTSIAR